VSAKHAAIKLLARREHSADEIRTKLLRKEFALSEIDAAIRDIQQADLQSDARYTQAYIRSRRMRGFGPVRIGMELRERGVSDAIVLEHLKPDNRVWLETLKHEYEKKFGVGASEDFQEKAKRMRFLQYRGFLPENIHEVVK